MSSDVKKIEEIQKRVQEYLEDIPLLVVGSGASMPYGIPSMSGLATHLKDSLDPIYSDDKEWQEISQKLNEGVDLETALSDKKIEDKLTKDIVKNVWIHIQNKDIDFFNNYILKNENKFPYVDLLNILLDTAQKKVSIITTNYDRLFEYASEACGAFYCCNFLGHYFGNHSDSLTYPTNERRVNISKVHGSLDWFMVNGSLIKKITHVTEINDNLEPLIITPGLEKYKAALEEPYRSFFTNADKEIINATSFLCIGYGFNDSHFHPKLKQKIEAGKPIVILSRTLRVNGRNTIKNARKYVVIEKGDDEKSSKITTSDGDCVMINQPIWQLDSFIKWVW